MADDIDIEEHDVLENPLIKKIFPDLTILKKEINDYNNYSMMEISPNPEESSNAVTVQSVTVSSIHPGYPKTAAERMREYRARKKKETLTVNKKKQKKSAAERTKEYRIRKKMKIHSGYEHEDSSQISIGDEWSSTTQAETTVIEQNRRACSSGLINKKFENKIILGSKHSSSKQNKQNFNVCIKKAKVCLPNVTQILNNNNKFCKVCLILFSSQETFNRHTLLAHKNTQKKNIVNEHKVKKIHECQICYITFSSLGNLKRHERNIHSHNRKKDGDSHMTEVNVMGDINDSNSNSLTERECFHCDMIFTTQQLLIDHLYEVLNSKKTQIASNKTCPEDIQQINKTNEQIKEVRKKNGQEHQDMENDNIKDVNTDKIYVCPICSYCFNIWDFYEAHMKKKHGVNKVKWTNKVVYEPKCKFCELQYTTYKSYNTHLHKRHKNKILQKVQIQSCNNVKKITTKETRNLIVQRKQQNKQKIILGFKKKKFENTLIHQLNCKEQFNLIKNDVKVMALKTIVFKCTQCNIHFLTTESAKNHINHNVLENSMCIICEKYFKEKDMSLHLEQHKYSNYFSVNNISRKEDVTTKVKGKATVHRTLHKCPFCAVHFNKEHIAEHYSKCDTESSQSTYCKICDILIAENIKISHAKEHEVNELKPADFKVVEFKKIKNKSIRRKQYTSPKMYEQMYNLSYCNVCKCNIARAHYKSSIHLQSRCSHFIKYVCKYCGLVFSNKSINTHRKLHQKFCNVSLKDFKFYDLKSGKKILPPVPVFPKCNSCEKHFITKFEVKRHVCHSNNHLTCATCKMKLSHTAYKLHIPFHNLTLDNVYKEADNTLVSDDVSHDINIAALSDELQSKEELITIFKCKNCVVSFNFYDEAINHCHSHTDLDSINQDTFECRLCKLTYDVACYEEHQRLHNDFDEGTFKIIKFDVFHFGSPNDKWLKYMFGSMPQNVVHGIVKNAIYKYETRVKMRILQNGSPDTTVFKCEKCQCFIDGNAIYKHSKTCNESHNYVCNVCHLPVNASSSDDHEKCNSILRSFRIIEFNGKQDEDVNYKIASMRKCYILYECRLCHSVVDKNYENHLCVVGTSKECSICGLLLNELDYNIHISKHKRLPSFNENFIKVILLGAKPNVNNSFQRYSDKLSRFSGIVCDYMFYKCLNCDVCVRDQRNTSQHYCLIDAAKSKCPKCDLTFDEGKLKGHLKLHDTDPDFVKETIFVQTFGTNKSIENIKPCENTEVKEDIVSCVSGNTALDLKDQSNTNSETVKIYKCVCGLHYLTEETIKVHTKKCNGKIKTKQSKQNCSKCDLTFSPNILFKHLIEHHGNKDILFQYEVISLNDKPL